MADPNASGLSTDRRVSTGSAGLDAMLEGGLLSRRPYLVVGPSGTGKTTLALQFLVEGVRRGERGLFVTVEEPPNEIRVNHRGLGPALDEVEVFDAIPDIMRYERVPFKDIASVRSVNAFKHVPLTIRRSPELSAVEVTMTALEQMLRTEVQRRSYSRLVIDSLTALQYFCMKGFDPVAGGQAFLRFVSDLHVTTILTVESPLEDVETPERMLARGEIRLFRWELDERTVRAVGVEKFRGSAHDVRLHPYRIGSQGIDVNLDVTISRDTRQIMEPMRVSAILPQVAATLLEQEVISPIDPLAEQVRDFVTVGTDLSSIRVEIESALSAAAALDPDRAGAHLARANSLLIGLATSLREGPLASRTGEPKVGEAYQRIVQRSEAARVGLPPTKLPPPKVLEVQLEWLLSLIRPPSVGAVAAEAEAEVPSVPARVTAPVIAPATTPVTAPVTAPPASKPSRVPMGVQVPSLPAPALESPAPIPMAVAAKPVPSVPAELSAAATSSAAPHASVPSTPSAAAPVLAVASPPSAPSSAPPLPAPPSPALPAPPADEVFPLPPPPSRPRSAPPSPPGPPLPPMPTVRPKASPPVTPAGAAGARDMPRSAGSPVPAKPESRPPLPSVPAGLVASVFRPAVAPPRPTVSRGPEAAPASPAPLPPAAREKSESIPPPRGMPAAAASAAKKRRRKAPVVRRKESVRPIEPVATIAPVVPGPPIAPVAQEAPAPSPPGASAVPEPVSTPTPVVKVKRRTTRKRKAPPVVNATPGRIPEATPAEPPRADPAENLGPPADGHPKEGTGREAA